MHKINETFSFLLLVGLFVQCIYCDKESNIFQPATRIVEKIAKGKVSSEEIVLEFWNHAHAVNPAINAIVEFNPNAIEEARELDEYYRKHNKVKGKLHGLPVTVKEHIGVKGLHMTRGLMVFADFIATEDSSLVKRLRNEGAVILGTTNMMESGLAFHTDNPIYGETKNPYDSKRSPGGSSGGEGAIIAAGGSPLGFGSDLGGSIRIPANNCGIMGIKPTTGRFSRHGTSQTDAIIGFIPGFISIGPMARYISDLELALEVLSGPDSSDPFTLIPPYIKPIQSVLKNIAYFTDDGLFPIADHDTVSAVDKSVEVLKSRGIKMLNDFPIAITQASDLMYRLCGYNGLEDLQAIFRSIDSRLVRNLYHEIHNDSTLRSTTAKEKEQLDDDIILYKAELAKFFDKYDALIMPASAFPALLSHESHDTKAYARGVAHFRFTYAWNVAQFPAMVVGAVHETKGGIPIGVQIIVPPFREDILFQIGRMLEENIKSVSSLRPSKLLEQSLKPYRSIPHLEL